MKRFKSRIESLRRMREQTEQLARLQAAVRQQEKQEADNRLADIADQISAVAAQGADELNHGRIEILQSIVNSTARLESERKIAATEQAMAEQLLIQAVKKVAAAKTELKIAETHIEKEQTEHRRRNLIEEENQRQENAAQRFAKA